MASQSFICGNVKTYELQEDSVQNLMFNISLGLDIPPPRHYIQCGLPGINWRVCSHCEDRNLKTLLNNVSEMLSTKEHRDWHYYWHAIRRELSFDANNLPPTEERLNSLARQGWIKFADNASFHPKEDFNQFIKNHAVGGELAGEDFLFMHRQMIKMLQVEQSVRGMSCIAPWYEIPTSPLDREWPVPRAKYFSEKSMDISYEKMELDNILYAAEELKSDKYLRKVSLNRLGLDIEARIHGKLHILYAAPHSKCIDPMTDNSIECSDLTHDRSSHVNKYFWKLHGFIDQLIGLWLKANNYSYVYKNCKESPDINKCYQWKGTWLGKEIFPIK